MLLLLQQLLYYIIKKKNTTKQNTGIPGTVIIEIIKAGKNQA